MRVCLWAHQSRTDMQPDKPLPSTHRPTLSALLCRVRLAALHSYVRPWSPAPNTLSPACPLGPGHLAAERVGCAVLGRSDVTFYVGMSAQRGLCARDGGSSCPPASGVRDGAPPLLGTRVLLSGQPPSTCSQVSSEETTGLGVSFHVPQAGARLSEMPA